MSQAAQALLGHENMLPERITNMMTVVLIREHEQEKLAMDRGRVRENEPPSICHMKYLLNNLGIKAAKLRMLPGHHFGNVP